MTWLQTVQTVQMYYGWIVLVIGAVSGFLFGKTRRRKWLVAAIGINLINVALAIFAWRNHVRHH